MQKQRNRLTINGAGAGQFSYYEYKYFVPHHRLTQVQSILDELCGNLDPFPRGIVDSIYYDSCDERLFGQCLNGDADKYKFRIRGYGDGHFHQVHQKIKTLSGVGKIKSKIQPVSCTNNQAPTWEGLVALEPELAFSQISFNSLGYAPLHPSVRVKYFRYRFRIYDYRITLDTQIEVSALANGLPRSISYEILPYHVLEIKTTRKRPTLPFMGLVKLQQVSFSKFMLGINHLNWGDGTQYP